MANGTLLLQSTRQAIAGLAESHDLFAGSEVALTNLRWQMVGFTSMYPEASQADVKAVFATFLGNKGSNAFNLILQRKWTDTVALLSQMRLVSVISIYEGWLESAALELGLVSNRKRSAWKAFVEPVNASSSINAVEELLGPQFAPMADVAAVCQASKLCMPTKLLELGSCFRAFKELRNALAHSGCRASAYTVDKYNEYQSVLASWPGITKTAPHIPVIVEGEPVEISGYEVVGFSEVLRLMLFTFDGLISGTEPAFRAAVRQYQSVHGSTTVWLSSNRAAAKGKLFTTWFNAKLPKPKPGTGDELVAELARRGVIGFRSS